MSGIIRKEDMHESFWKEGVSNPNLLINGDFQVWQRGTSFGDIYNKYSADRWYVSKSSGTHSFEKIDKGMKVITNGTTYVQQYIENSSKLKNSLLTFTVSIDDVKYSITGKPIDGVFLDTTNVIIKIDCDESKNLVVAIIRINNTTSTINWAKLEIGSIPTAFHPRLYGEELALCQRYYIKYPVPQSLIITDATQIVIDVHLPVSLRVLPTILLDNDCYFHTTSSQTPMKIHSAGDSLGCQQIEGNLSDFLLWFCNGGDEYAVITDGLMGVINTSNGNGNKLSGACILEINAEIY